MKQYFVNFDYQARYGEGMLLEFTAGETVTLAPEAAEWVNRDSEGCLTLVEAAELSNRAELQPPADRQLKGARVRKDRQTHPGEGVMSRDDFKAVKDKDQ